VTDNTRRQLTLFVQKKNAKNIEDVRSKFNPKQRKLIDSHVTLCREDEIADMDKVLHNLTYLKQKIVCIKFGQVTRFDNGKGVLIPATGVNEEFQELRKKILTGVVDKPRRQEPHITLVHPINSNLTDKIFEIIENVNLPTQLNFKTISLIEQIPGGQWTVLKIFDLLK
jgi:2'-5' RNA ligase